MRPGVTASGSSPASCSVLLPLRTPLRRSSCLPGCRVIDALVASRARRGGQLQDPVVGRGTFEYAVDERDVGQRRRGIEIDWESVILLRPVVHRVGECDRVGDAGAGRTLRGAERQDERLAVRRRRNRRSSTPPSTPTNNGPSVRAGPLYGSGSDPCSRNPSHVWTAAGFPGAVATNTTWIRSIDEAEIRGVADEIQRTPFPGTVGL